jgi:hypothetical protein
MPLTSPNLDDRDFKQLMAEAINVIKKVSPQWTDLSPGDPGIALLEAFAYLTDVMIYRLNRLPEKAYIEFLRLLGVKLDPPAAASVQLRFSLSRPKNNPVEIPRHTRVTLARTGAGAEAPIFVTARVARIEPGKQEVLVLAHHCEPIEGELLGVGNGAAGQTFTVKRPPMVAPTDDFDLMVGVEAMPQEIVERVRAVKYSGKIFRIWSEVENLSEIGADRYVYLADRVSGTITFAPALRMPGGDGHLNIAPSLAGEVPNAGLEIRAWYRCGGGPEGNVAAHTLTTLKDPIPGVEVTNDSPATGGRPVETVENALFRGPQRLHSLQRAVTARDFEQFAERSSGAVARAKAFTKAALRRHAQPGTIEVLLVPWYLPDDERSNGAVTAARLNEQETEEARARIQAALDERRPLGTTCQVNWVRYKTVRVKAHVVVYRGEDPASVKARVLDRLHQTINPLPTPLRRTGWRFGEPLRQFDVYDTVREEPGVRYVDDVLFLVDQVPDKQVSVIARDAFQPHTWYAASSQMVFRTLNDGDGWELGGRFSGENVKSICPHPEKPGLLALATSFEGDGARARVHISEDCGENWRQVAHLTFRINDLAWMTREGIPVLLLATERGLYELPIQTDASPVQIEVAQENPSIGFYTVAVARTVRGGVFVAAAAISAGGIFLSDRGGRSKTFSSIGLKGEDLRVLEVQHDGPRSFLWAGTFSPGNEPGRGTFKFELGASAEGWRHYLKDWNGGSCRAITFLGSKIIAATHHAGVVWLDSSKEDPVWQPPGIRCGLPLRSGERIFHPVESVVARTSSDIESELIIAGGPEGIYRSADGGSRYENCSSGEFTRMVTIPETWLLCSGEHDVEVVSEDETN